MNKVQKFFGTDSLLKSSVAVFSCLLIVNIMAKVFMANISLFISDFFFLMCVLFLYVAFLFHNKNVQKGLLGAALMWYFVDELSYVINGILLNKEVFKQYSGFAGKGYILLSVLTWLLYTVFFINHFMLTGDHASNPKIVKAELILGVVMTVVSIVSIFFQIPVLYPDKAACVESVSWHIVLAAFLTMIGSYEAHFEKWKEKRETAEIKK